ncbi:hypothetical protein [Microbacterium schleiferi]
MSLSTVHLRLRGSAVDFSAGSVSVIGGWIVSGATVMHSRFSVASLAGSW